MVRRLVYRTQRTQRLESQGSRPEISATRRPSISTAGKTRHWVFPHRPLRTAGSNTKPRTPAPAHQRRRPWQRIRCFSGHRTVLLKWLSTGDYTLVHTSVALNSKARSWFGSGVCFRPWRTSARLGGALLLRSSQTIRACCLQAPVDSNHHN